METFQSPQKIEFLTSLVFLILDSKHGSPENYSFFFLFFLLFFFQNRRCVHHISYRNIWAIELKFCIHIGNECSYLEQFLGSFVQGVSELGDLKVEKYIEIFSMLFQPGNLNMEIFSWIIFCWVEIDLQGLETSFFHGWNWRQVWLILLAKLFFYDVIIVKERLLIIIIIIIIILIWFGVTVTVSHSTKCNTNSKHVPCREAIKEVIGRGSDGIINLTLGDLERSDRGHLLKNRVSVRDSATVTIEH